VWRSCPVAFMVSPALSSQELVTALEVVARRQWAFAAPQLRDVEEVFGCAVPGESALMA